MKTSTTLVALLAASTIFVTGCQTSRTTGSRWEYKVIEKKLYPGELQKQIDAVAQDGWEFVSVSTTVQEASVPHGFIVVRRPKQ
ncbi:MAG: DUF4177 domain-containing protein [Verrucomicrobia bacterium]|nr:DUF4177 domain-containing protein [Verrucomicrobiota bacterium]